MTSTYTSSVSFDAGLHVMGQIFPFLGIQAEVLFTMDRAPNWGTDTNSNLTALEYESLSYSLTIPLVIKGTFRYKRFLIAPFAGAYFTMPMGKMTEIEKHALIPEYDDDEQPVTDDKGNPVYKIESKGTEEEWGYTIPFGLTGGIVFGVRLGPGTLFLDTRYSYDLGDTRARRAKVVRTKNEETGADEDRTETNFESIYRRSGVSFTLGYEFNLFKKKPKK
ncbi:hypothetical protein FACS189485_01480 [Spirochaetia bacterium]|nr:hypothetical protein FACS189485_01480 [Spirochaetia bacterium]